MIFGQPVIRLVIGLAFILAIVAFFSMRSCESQREKAAQAKQEARSADAYAGAAKEAVATITDRSAAEEDLRQVVHEAAKDIANAEGSDQPIPPAARNAALRAACQLRDYRDHPACAVLPANP